MHVPEADVEPNQEVVASVNVTDEISGVDMVILSYTTDNGTSWNNITMTYNSSAGLYETPIPGQPEDTAVKYKITAYDEAGNFDVNDNAGQYYLYTVVPEFQSALILLLFVIVTSMAIVLIKYECARREQGNLCTRI